jgi:hypothetical protein
VVLHRNCAVKDVLVLVKAKVTDHGDWRVVGVAAADVAGNFSIPYPYGTYVAAQVSCSVAPRDIATIPIVAKTGDQTISDGTTRAAGPGLGGAWAAAARRPPDDPPAGHARRHLRHGGGPHVGARIRLAREGDTTPHLELPGVETVRRTTG